MNRETTKDEKFLDALDDLYIEGILAASPEELKAELLALGEDPDALAAVADAAFARAHAACAADTCAAPTSAAPAADPVRTVVSAAEGGSDPFAVQEDGGLRGVARSFGCNLNFLGRLKDRLIRVEDLSAGFLARLAAALGTGADELARFLAGPARVPVAARFKSDVKPEAVEKQSLAEAIESSGLSDEQKRHLASL
ncbi:hypothetical protein ACFQE0_20535 [Methylobacterium komagatae]|uniref:Uncharacterized protein n=1 Tax=Methylobacterium komagatae TaxID=374425 RepID=A0ABW2BMT3_9HYPH|nr:hypothetical protein [Methylobacterium organophilum]PVZ05272.1 hypothetical protein C7388_105266 [Methylobacterium organophilum]